MQAGDAGQYRCGCGHGYHGGNGSHNSHTQGEFWPIYNPLESIVDSCKAQGQAQLDKKHVSMLQWICSSSLWSADY